MLPKKPPKVDIWVIYLIAIAFIWVALLAWAIGNKSPKRNTQKPIEFGYSYTVTTDIEGDTISKDSSLIQLK